MSNLELIKKLAGAWKELPASQKQVWLCPFPECFELYRWWDFILFGVFCGFFVESGGFLKGLKKHVCTKVQTSKQVGELGAFNNSREVWWGDPG